MFLFFMLLFVYVLNVRPGFFPVSGFILSRCLKLASGFLHFPLAFGYQRCLRSHPVSPSFARCFCCATSFCRCWTCSWRSCMVSATWSGFFSLCISVSMYPATLWARFSLSSGMCLQVAMALVTRRFTISSWFSIVCSGLLVKVLGFVYCLLEFLYCSAYFVVEVFCYLVLLVLHFVLQHFYSLD